MGLKRYGAAWERLSWKDAEQVETFMSILLKEKVKCTAIMEGCNFCNGCIYWIVYIQFQ